MSMNPETARLNWFDRLVAFGAPQWGLRRAAARSAMQMLGQFRGADVTNLRADWVLPGGGGSHTPDAFELSALRERSRDAVRNDPVAVGALDTYANNVVGSGLIPQSRLRADVLGISEERAKVLQRQAESAWAVFSPMAGADNRLNMDELQFLALSKIIEDGEVIAIPTWADDSWRPFGRCIELIESDRLCNTLGVSEKSAVNGIVYGPRGEPKTYYVRKAGKTAQSTAISAFDADGRPKILHVFPTRRPGQQRGIPVFAPILTRLRDLSKYQEATLVTARVAACLAVFITQQNQFGPLGNDKTNASGTFSELSPGMVARLRQGEAINVVQPNQPGDVYAGYVESLLRMIGMALGLPYELLVKDFSKTNYSSARAALLEGRRMFIRWRKWLAAKFCQPIWDMVLEEAFLRGMFDAKDFYGQRHEYCRAMWIGGSWGWVDPVKEVEAARKAIDYGLSNLAEECAAQGRDWEENIEQLGREQAYIEEKQARIDRSRPEQEVKSTGEDDPDKKEKNDSGLDFDGMKQKADAYGVAVRAGAITPQDEDEDLFREEMGLPAVSNEVKSAWEEDGGVRRPITLKYKWDKSEQKNDGGEDGKSDEE